jgi:hypothetical protein
VRRNPAARPYPPARRLGAEHLTEGPQYEAPWNEDHRDQDPTLGAVGLWRGQPEMRW